MIQIKPILEFKPKCIYCQASLRQTNLIWQGIHVVSESKCPKCKSEFFVDLPVGHAALYPFIIDKNKWELFGEPKVKNWFGDPLLISLRHPSEDKIGFSVIKKKRAREVVVLNCIDYLYGHSLLKLLNAERFLKDKANVIVIIPKILKWMVPAGVTEIWMVDVPIKWAQNYYLDLDEKIKREFTRFSKVYLAEDCQHPLDFNIENFTRTKPHNFEPRNYRVTFIWREDRPWFFSDYLVYGAKKINLLEPLVWWQNIKIRILFYLLKRKLPNVKFAVAGIGQKTSFPRWIEDIRFLRPNAREEKRLCKVYAESRVVIGVHGSNMLLPSAHAGTTINLLPDIKIGLIAADVLYQQRIHDPRVISFAYRYVPITIPIITLARTVFSIISQREETLRRFEIF